MISETAPVTCPDADGYEDVASILERDPTDTFRAMTQRSRSEYLQSVDWLASRSGQSMQEVARHALRLAASAQARTKESGRSAHIGYYLVGRGFCELADELNVRLDWRQKLHLRSTRSLLLAHCFAIFGICAIYGFGSVSLFDFRLSLMGRTLLAIVTTLYASYIVQNWVNMFVVRLLSPRRMPRIDFSKGIPDAFRTLTVIPCLLTSTEGTAKLAGTLEALHRANEGIQTVYALLSDFVDAANKHEVDDEALLQDACNQIAALNERHGQGFALLHRPRRWNDSEQRWIGWERKRGKLEELNAYLLGSPSPFQIIHGDTARILDTKFVVTLDDDNADLPAGAIADLVGAIAHPLNRGELDSSGTKIVAGFGVLQPRPMITLPKDAQPSRLELLLHSLIEIETTEKFRSDEPAIDVDQDLFGQVAYGGKGIYEVALFHRLTHGRIPENTVLSHDVLEGGMVRAGVLSDLILPEPFLATFYAAAQRSHRWLRGDWQLLPWLLPRVRGSDGRYVRNTLSLFGRWKIFNNILRMMLPVASLLCFVVGWATCVTPGLWTLDVLAIAWLPAIVELLLGIARNLLSGKFRSTARGIWSWLSLRSAGFIFGVDQAQMALDAAARASFRMLISHRRLLEWKASSVVSSQQVPTLAQYLRLMWVSPVFAIGLTFVIARINPSALSSELPFAALWLAAPFIAWWWSQIPPQVIQPAPQTS